MHLIYLKTKTKRTQLQLGSKIDEKAGVHDLSASYLDNIAAPIPPELGFRIVVWIIFSASWFGNITIVYCVDTDYYTTLAFY